MPLEAVAAIPPIITTATGAALNLNDPTKRTIGWWLAGAAAWLLATGVLKILNAGSQDRDAKAADEHVGLKASLRVLYGTVLAATGTKEGDGNLRVTLHRVVEPPSKGRGPAELEQMFPYLGDSSKKFEPRRFPIQSGIIGRAAREKAAIAASRQNEDYEAFIAELVTYWSYTEADARALSAGRKSWMAVPILGPGDETRAVVYLDSVDPLFFSDPVQDLILAGCSGITAYTREAYK